MTVLLQDLRSAFRAIPRNPGFSAVAVLTLALGIGATAAIFTVLNAVVLSPLPYPQPERMVRLENRVPGVDTERNWGLSPAGYFHFQENSRGLESVAVYTTPEVSLTGDGPAERVQMARVSANLFSVLRVRPALGRLITPEDNQVGSDATSVNPGPAVPVAVLSHDLWVRRYGSDPKIVGKSIEVSGLTVPVVGVLEAGADLPDPGVNVDIWFPLGLNPSAPATNWHTFQAIGRLEDGVSPAALEDELARFTSRFTELYPSAYSEDFMEETGFTPVVIPLRDAVVGDVSGTLWMLLAAVLLVLLIACANVANLFLVRTEGRRREMALRAAMGATRGRLARQFLSEGLVLGLVGGAGGLLLAYVGVDALVAGAPEGLPRMEGIGIGGDVIAFVLILSVLVGLAVGSFPLLRFSASTGSAAIRNEGRGATAGRERNITRNLLVVSQVAMAVVLLASAGLLLRSFQQLRSVEPGFDPSNILTMELALPFVSYRGYEEVSAFYQELTRRVEGLPGVVSAGVSDDMPLVSSGACATLTVDEPPASDAAAPGCITTNMAAPGFFETLRIPVQGELPTWNDVNQRSGGVVVSRALAERLWPGEDPIGKGIRGNGAGEPYYRVVGVAGDVRANGLDHPPIEVVHFPLIPLEGAGLWGAPNGATLVVRTANDRPEALAGAIRALVTDLDAEVPIANIRTMESIVAESVARTSFAMTLLAVAAAAALILGAVGLYGVLSFVVGQRQKEMGIRIALGARVEQVASMVVTHALVLATVGVGVGIVAALAVTRVLQSLLFEVSATDPITLIAVSVTLLVVALGAAYLPARRATRVDPMIALRAE
ncbi:MAG TPA: ABC transporter permease [Longimicrobiaceae bacterium]|nr:ABC transporter permease [Longimicrobiaceae bacterium]